MNHIRKFNESIQGIPMIRIVKMTGKYYGLKIKSIEDDMENIHDFTNEGPIILVQDIEDLDQLDIDPTEVIMVEPED